MTRRKSSCWGCNSYIAPGEGFFPPRVGADENDLEDISSLAGIIEGVDCGAVLRELKPGEWKLSLRTGANGRVNATRACGLLGGGGHAMAAGASLQGTLEQVKERVLAAVDQVKRD